MKQWEMTRASRPSTGCILPTIKADKSQYLPVPYALSRTIQVWATEESPKNADGRTRAHNSSWSNWHFRPSSSSTHWQRYCVLKKVMPSGLRISSLTNLQFNFGRKFKTTSSSVKSSNALRRASGLTSNTGSMRTASGCSASCLLRSIIVSPKSPGTHGVCMFKMYPAGSRRREIEPNFDNAAAFCSSFDVPLSREMGSSKMAYQNREPVFADSMELDSQALCGRPR